MSARRVGLVGLGMMGRHHARVLREVEDLEFVAVADAMGDPHNAAAGIPLLSSVDELIEAGIDMAVVAVPTGMHEEVGLALAEAGVHTLVEKPIAASMEEGRHLVEAFESRNLVGAVGHIERFNPALQSLRSRIANGDLGEIYQIATRRQGPFPARVADVGVVKDLATHDIDLTAWLAQSKYDTVFARTTTRSGRQYEDMVSATGQLQNGIVTNHIINWLSPYKERVTVVTGENGTFVANTLTMDLTFFENGKIPTSWGAVSAFRGVSEGNMTRIAIPKPEPLLTEHEVFRDAVSGFDTDVVTMSEGLETLTTAEALLLSAKTATPISPKGGSR